MLQIEGERRKRDTCVRGDGKLWVVVLGRVNFFYE